MIFKIVKDEKGQVAVLVVFLFIVLCGFVGLAIDVANLFYNKNQLQNSVDFAALSAAQKTVESHEKVVETATAIANKNDIPSGNLTVTHPYGGSDLKVKVAASKSVKLFFLPVLGIENSKTVSAEAVAEAKKSFGIVIFVNGPSKLLNIKSDSTINGDIHSQGDINLQLKSITINGNVTACGTITDKGATTYGVFPDSDSKEIPEYVRDTPTITYSGDLDINSALDIPADEVIFVDGNVHITAPIKGSGKIYASGDIKFDGNSINFGSQEDSVTFYAGGNIRFDGTKSTFAGIFYAEKSIELHSSNSTYYSRFYCDEFTITANCNNITPPKTDSYDVYCVLIE